MYEDTNKKYSLILQKCFDLFLKKTQDYGTAWRILRPLSVIDQIFIKLNRIKNIQEKKHQKIEDSIQDELIGIINYSIIGLIQMDLQHENMEELPLERVQTLYQIQSDKAFQLMQSKNHDYGEAWKDISAIGFVDLMLMKIFRMKQIINNQGITIVSEGIDANYLDIINYAIFMQIVFYEK